MSCPAEDFAKKVNKELETVARDIRALLSTSEDPRAANALRVLTEHTVFLGFWKD